MGLAEVSSTFTGRARDDHAGGQPARAPGTSRRRTACRSRRRRRGRGPRARAPRSPNQTAPSSTCHQRDAAWPAKRAGVGSTRRSCGCERAAGAQVRRASAATSKAYQSRWPPGVLGRVELDLALRGRRPPRPGSGTPCAAGPTSPGPPRARRTRPRTSRARPSNDRRAPRRRRPGARPSRRRRREVREHRARVGRAAGEQRELGPADRVEPVVGDRAPAGRRSRRPARQVVRRAARRRARAAARGPPRPRAGARPGPSRTASRSTAVSSGSPSPRSTTGPPSVRRPSRTRESGAWRERGLDDERAGRVLARELPDLPLAAEQPQRVGDARLLALQQRRRRSSSTRAAARSRRPRRDRRRSGRSPGRYWPSSPSVCGPDEA